MKYDTVIARGFWEGEPNRLFDMPVALGSWDGVADAEDEGIFYYMDGSPLTVGSVIAENFVVVEIDE